MLLTIEEGDLVTLLNTIEKLALDIQSSCLHLSDATTTINTLSDNEEIIYKHGNLQVSDHLDISNKKKQTKHDSNSNANIVKSCNNNISTNINKLKNSATKLLTLANKEVYKSSDRFQQVAYAGGRKSNENGYNTLPKKLLPHEFHNTKPTDASTLTVKSYSDYELTITVPQENDTLFWSFYSLVYGNTAKAYEFLHNTCETEQDTRFSFIDVIRSNKDIIKPLKISRAGVEENIIHDKSLSIKSVVALSHALRCMNLLYVCGRTYHEVMLDESLPFHIIQKHRDKDKYGYCVNVPHNKINNIRDNLWHMENMDKPIKSISSYKADDLRSMCTQLQINITDEKCTKQVMYDRITQYLSA